ncbi:MAG: hypothetical protein QNJ98_11800 [Planctomycetota bacterium]|nr:hypothetical protein [Planctomycetota bacterium]
MDGSGGFPIGRIGALLTLVGMTALPFVSCGPIDIDGHEFLRNKTPDTSDLEGALNDSLGNLGGEGGESPFSITPTEPDASGEKKKEHIFEDDDLWLWFVYLGVFGLAVIGLLLPDGLKLSMLVGVLGMGGVVFFIDRFENMVFKDSTEALGLGGGFDWEVGAFLALGGFILVAVGGLRQVASGPPD